ncbi:MAG: PH domain-containing protein [Acidimicrobiales bacterium]
MPFPRKLLTDGESVVVELNPTWLVLGWPLVAAVAVAVLAIALAIGFPNTAIHGVVGYMLLVLVIAAGGWLAIRWLRWRTTSIVLTTTRILERRGVLSRQGEEIRLDRINELSYRQTLVERIVRTGSLVVEVGGETGVVVFGHLPQPAAVQSLVTEQIDALRRSKLPWQPQAQPQQGPPGVAQMQPAYAPVPGMPPPPMAQPPVVHQGPTVADRLVQLDDLRQRGILSDAEFQAKKTELLKQL